MSNDNDAGIFQFGSSSIVHDDLRRTLTAEADAINKSNIKINEATGVETKVRHQVLKDRSLSHNEMVRLRRSSGEFVERLGMSEQLRQGISKTLAKEFNAMATQQDDDIESRANGGNNNNNNNNSGNNENQENIPPGARPASLQSLKESFQATSEETAHLINAIAEGQALLYEVSSEIANIEANKREVQSEFDPLNADLAKAQSVTISYQQSLEAETQRHLSLKTTLSSMEADKEQLAKEIEEMQKEMADENEAFTAEETELANNLAAHSEEERCHSHALVDVESEIARIFTHTEMFHKDHTQFMEVSKSFQSKKEEYEKERVSRNQLFTTKNELESEMTRVEKKVTRAKHAVIELEDKWTKVAGKKVVNDGIEAEQIVPGRAELDALVAEKDKLLRLAQELENKLPITFSLDQDKERLEDLKAQISTATKLANEKNEILNGLFASRKAAQEAHEKKQVDLAAAIQDAKKTKATESKRRADANEAAKEERRFHAAELYNKLEILQYGSTLILDSKQTEERETKGNDNGDDDKTSQSFHQWYQ